MIDRQDLINLDSLRRYILNCQDLEEDGTGGGFADRPGNETDVFHTFFGLTALSLMGHYDLDLIDHTYAIPKEAIRQNFPHLYEPTESS
jgi:geranylgeranyl transferase type-2 subunit beta